MDFKYLCIDPSGRELTGNLSSENREKAKRLLKERGLNVVSLEQIQKASSLKRSFAGKGRIKESDLYNLVKELSVLLRAGLRIDISLETLIESTPNENLRSGISSVKQDMREGATVSEAFQRTGIFSPLIITMLRVGESVGDLKMVFEYIARHLKFQIAFKSEIRNALTYPVFLIFASFVTLFVIFKFIIPRFFSVFGQGQEQFLPFTAKVLYTIGEALNIYVLIAVLAAVIIILKLTNMKKLFSLGYSFAFSLPLLKTLILNLEMSRFSYSMHTMIASGIEFINALRLSTGLIQNKKIRHALEPSVKLIKEGRGIAEVFSQIDMLPDIVVNMISVGEKSGNMEEIFLEIFHVFDDRFQGSVKTMVTLIEPVIITIMGLIVGFIVISLILTVMSVGNIQL